MSEEEKRRHLIVVGITDRDNFRARVVIEELQISSNSIQFNSIKQNKNRFRFMFLCCLFAAFPQEIHSGLVELVRVPAEHYPWNLVMEPCKLARNYGDKLSYVMDRSKQVSSSFSLLSNFFSSFVFSLHFLISFMNVKISFSL
jgi:hypothetical protein